MVSFASGQDDVLVEYAVTDDWSSGFGASLAITSRASFTVDDWELAFELEAQITAIWNAEIQSQQGNSYVLTGVDASWDDGDLTPGEVISIGFNGAPGGVVPVPTQLTLNGAPMELGVPSAAPQPAPPAPAPTWPWRTFAPYIDATGWPPYDLVGAAESQGLRHFSLGFVVADPDIGCSGSWGGYYPADGGWLGSEINALRALGGDVVISFGGAAGTELAQACSDVAELQAAYQAVIDAYGLTHVDFDIEGHALAQPASVALRSQAIAGLQAAAAAAERELHVSFTLPVLPSGLTLDGVALLQSALDAGVEIGLVNVMAMDYGGSAAPNPQGQMGAYAIKSASSTKAQIEALYAGAGIPRTQAELWHLVGVTPMIGVNDVVSEIFELSDAQELLAFAQANDLGLLSMWSANRDFPCPGGPQPQPLNDCNSIDAPAFAFSQTFLPFTSGAWVESGAGLAGVGGVPLLAGEGPLVGGSVFTLALSDAAPDAAALLVSGVWAIELPLLGGVLVPYPHVVKSMSTDSAGTLSLSAQWPLGIAPGTSLVHQVWIGDAAAAQGFSASNALTSVGG